MSSLHAVQDFARELAAVEVRAGCGQLHHCERLDEIGVEVQRYA
jgi:hypothetical protein